MNKSIINLMLLATASVSGFAKAYIDAAPVSDSVFDESGLVEVKLFRATDIRPTWSAGHFQDIQIDVADDFVVIGGGVDSSFNGGAGQYLITSRPTYFSNRDSNYLKSWTIEMKDHSWPDRTEINAYAIGMRITGLSTDQLKSLITISLAGGATENHPRSSINIPAGHVLIGGGASILEWDNGETGNLILGTAPQDSQTWASRSKDHEYPYPAQVTSYAISMPSNIPSIGTIYSNYWNSQSSNASTIELSQAVQPGYVLTGCGGGSNYATSSGAAGKYIIDIIPQLGTGTGGTCHVQWKSINYHDYTTRVHAAAVGLKGVLAGGDQGGGTGGGSTGGPGGGGPIIIGGDEDGNMF